MPIILCWQVNCWAKLRHTFATRLRAANVHEYDIADLLGHSTTPNDTRNT
jgi:integrase